jgi:capsular polysaccharide biosynthesis protein
MFHQSSLQYQYGNVYEMPEVFIAGVRNARVYSDDFLVLSADNQIFFESAMAKTEVLEKNGILDRLVWPSHESTYGTACLLGQHFPFAYYHWLIEMLPKLSLLEPHRALQDIPLILPNGLKAYQRDSLSFLGIGAERIVPFDNSCWRFDELVFPAMLGPTGCPSIRAVEWLRARILSACPPVQTTPKRLYITRRDATQRRVLNEEQVISLLQRKGFTIVCPGDLSFAQQVELFSNVQIVVAAHGAGVANMVFAPEHAVLIELFGDNYINGCFWAIANIRGQRYGFLTGPAQWLNYTISVENLERLLDKMVDAT